MKFVRFNDDRLGLLSAAGDGVIDLTDRLELESEDPLCEYMAGDYDASEYADSEPDHDVDDVTLESPVDRPGKVVAAPLNYESHIDEALEDSELPVRERFSIEDRGYFLKAPSSVIGPEDDIVVPFNDRRVDHEVELGFVIGEEGQDLSADEAWDHIFGYTILLDISVRGEQDRSNRKSYNTFTVIGPCVVTPDEVGDPQDLLMELAVNGEVRQHERTTDMVYNCAEVLQYASIGATIEVGDVLTTGTPEGVGPITGGDVIDAEIESIGSMSIDVTERDVSFADLDVQKSG